MLCLRLRTLCLDAYAASSILVLQSLWARSLREIGRSVTDPVSVHYGGDLERGARGDVLDSPVEP